MRRLGLALAAVAMFGCHEMTAPDSDADSRQQALETANSPAKSEAHKIEVAEKKAWKEGQPVEQQIDWAAADAWPTLSVELPKEAATKLDRASLPVLLPNEPALLNNVFATVGDTWYSARLRGEGLTVNVQGNRAAFRHPSFGPDVKAKAGDFHIARSHHIVTLSTTYFGVSYVIDVECAELPDTDKRCTEDAFVTGLAEKLQRAGGQQ